MTAFSERFNYIKNEKGLKCIDIAKMCDMDVSVIFRWMNGERLPESIDSIEKLQYGLRLTDDEKNELEKAYIISIYGNVKYSNFEEIVKVIMKMKRIRQRGDSEVNNNVIDNVDVETEITTRKEFLVLNDKEDIIRKTGEMFKSCIHMKEKKVRIITHSMSRELETIFTLHFSEIKGYSIEYVYLQKTDEIDGLEQIVDIAFSKNDIKIWLCSEKTETNDMNRMLMGNMLLQYNNDMTEGLFVTYTEWVQMESDTFECIKNKAKLVCMKEIDGIECVDVSYKDNFNINVLECQPCVIDCLNETLIREHFYENLPMREEMINMILQNYVFNKNRSDESCFYFTKEGLCDFLSTGILMVFPYPVYSPFTLEERCNIVRRSIETLNNKDMRLIKDKRLDGLRDIHLEYVKDEDEECVIMDVNLKGYQKERLVFKSQSFTKVFADFFQCIQNEKYVYSKEETEQYVLKVVEKYEKRVHDMD